MEVGPAGYELKNKSLFLGYIGVLVVVSAAYVLCTVWMLPTSVLIPAAGLVLFISFQLVFDFILHGFIPVAVCCGLACVTGIVLYAVSGNPSVLVRQLYMFVPDAAVCLFLLFRLSRMNVRFLELNRIAFSDDLTGLMNRKKIISTISNFIEQGRRFHVMFIDMDNFKMINDSLGHAVGNIFLNEVAHNIQRTIDDTMLFGRMGGDEFMVVVPYESPQKSLMALTDAINKIVSTPFMYKSRSYIVTCSIGVATSPDDAVSSLDLLRKADMALYRAKGCGKKQAVFYNADIQHDFDQRLELEKCLHTAAENNELYLMFQPQFYAGGRRVRAYETLIRWNSPVFGNVEPSKFIPVAEENGDMLLLGSWIMKAAFSRYVTLRRERRIDDDVYLTLNISFVQFTSQLFLEEIKDAIDSTGMPGSRVELEITEYTCSHIPEISVERIKELKRMGISVVLDDFGIGYASLSFLRTLPFTAVKIDKSLIDTIDASSNSNLVKPVIELAHSIGLNVVAEGVENEMQYNCLLDWKCDFMQGFYLSKPVP